MGLFVIALTTTGFVACYCKGWELYIGSAVAFTTSAVPFAAARDLVMGNSVLARGGEG